MNEFKIQDLTPNKSVPFILIFISLFIFTSLLYASENQVDKTNVNNTNIGFMGNPSKQLANKFPICDVFLKVNWVGEGSFIGYSKHNTYLNGEKEPAVISFVVMSEFRHGINFSEFIEKQKGKRPVRLKVYDNLEMLMLYIENGKVEYHDSTRALSVSYNDKTLNFVTPLGRSRSLSNYKMNVCIPYADKKQVWIAEFNHFNNLYSEKNIKEKLNKIKSFDRFNMASQFFPFPLNINMFKSYFPLDINRDGVEDYYGNASSIYFYEGEYYRMQPKWEHETDKEYGWYGIPPTERVCKIKSWETWGLPLITDGINYYLANQCNLTELLSIQEQE